MIRADAELNAGGFLGTLKSLDQGVLRFAGGFAVLTKSFEGVGMIAQQVTALFQKAKVGLDLGGAFADLSASTGETIEDLAVVKQAFKNAGLGSEVLGPLGKFQKALAGANEEGGNTAEALGRLGVSGKDLANMPVLEQITALQAGFAGLTEKTERQRTAQEIFGKSGGKMLALLGDPEALSTARQQVGGMAGLLEKNAPVFDKLSDAIGAMDLKLEQLSVGALSIIAPQAAGFADVLNGIDFTSVGQQIGTLLQPLVQIGQGLVFLGGFLGDVVSGWVNMRDSAISAIDAILKKLGPLGPMLKALTAIPGFGIANSSLDFLDALLNPKPGAASSESTTLGGVSGGALALGRNVQVGEARRAGGSASGLAFLGSGPSGDPQLTEARTQTSELRGMRQQLSELTRVLSASRETQPYPQI